MSTGYNNCNVYNIIPSRFKRDGIFFELKCKTVSFDYRNMNPFYFNTGCCCFSDGDITGIEIADGFIPLIKWSETKGREVLEKKEPEKLV